MVAATKIGYRTTLPYGGITRIRFRGSFSPRRIARGPLTCVLTLMEMCDNCKQYHCCMHPQGFGYFP